jgi:signal peptidase I
MSENETKTIVDVNQTDELNTDNMIQNVNEQTAESVTQNINDSETVDNLISDTPIAPKISKFEKQKKIKRIVNKIISATIWVVGIVLLYLCLSNLYQQVFNPAGYTGFFGVGEAVVASDSMEPILYQNDLIFYKSATVEDIDKNDIIVYKKTNNNGDTMLIVHKVIDITDGYVVTKGENNGFADEAFPTSDIVGKYSFKVGKIGVILNLLSNKWAPFLIATLLIFVFGLRIFVYCWKRKRIIANISTREDNRSAIDHFFEI